MLGSGKIISAFFLFWEKIFIFLAVLNLLKEKRIFLKQKKLFGEITIQKYVS